MADEILTFVREIEKLKTIERLNMTSNLQRAESDAEHIWHLTMMVYLFSEGRPQIDKVRAMELALIHDLVEVYAGDTQLWDKNKRTPEQKKVEEEASAQKLFKLLPKDLEERFLDRWHEYEDRQTVEAKFVYALDKLQPLMQRVISGDDTWVVNKITVDKHGDVKPQVVKDDEELAKLWDELVAEGEKKGLFWRKNNG